MANPQVTNLDLERIVRELEKLKAEAIASGEDFALLAYLIDMALVEARSQRGE